ncbi:MAG: DUF2179 domain-containing protein [Nanoarchaeota archaeon]
MDITALLQSDMYAWFILPALIFIARIMDVSIGTIRVIFITRGYKALAPLLGFFEVLIWLLAIRQIMTNLETPLYFVAYAAGFATGTYVGMVIEERLSLGHVMLRVITEKDASALLEALRGAEHTVTTIGAQGKHGNVRVIFTVIERKDIAQALSTVKSHEPDAFYSIEDVRACNRKTHAKTRFGFGILRKGK